MLQPMPVLLIAMPESKALVENFFATEPSGPSTIACWEPDIQRFCAASKAGKKHCASHAYGVLTRAAPVVENFETVEALIGPKLITHGLSRESIAIEYGSFRPPPVNPFLPERMAPVGSNSTSVLLP